MGTDLSTEERLQIEMRLHAQDPATERQRLRQALTEPQPRIPARYFYDDQGSQLFEEITTTPEYYQTRTEAAILARQASNIIEQTQACELIELGSGSSTKTRALLDAMDSAGCLKLYVPVDVNRSMVEGAAAELLDKYDTLRVHGLIQDFTEAVAPLPDAGGTRCVIFLGGTFGNFRRVRAVAFLERVANALRSGEYFLLGVDLIKDPAVLEAAYNDSWGVTAEFNRNMLRVLNRRFGCAFDPSDFEHRAIYNPGDDQIEMRLRARRDQVVDCGELDLQLTLAAGDEILTEVSVKFDRPRVSALLAEGGFELCRWYTDPDQRFALALAQRR